MVMRKGARGGAECNGFRGAATLAADRLAAALGVPRQGHARDSVSMGEFPRARHVEVPAV